MMLYYFMVQNYVEKHDFTREKILKRQLLTPKRPIQNIKVKEVRDCAMDKPG